MQRHDFVNAKNIDDSFCELCRKIVVLPRKTPLFVTDFRGRILVKKHLSLPKGVGESVYDIIENSGDFASKSCDGLSFCLRLDRRILRGFATATPDVSGLYNVVVCSYSESGCFKLSDYFKKLSAFRDFLQRLCDENPKGEHEGALSVFASRMRGVGYLMEMSHERVDDSKITPVSLTHLIGKLSDFVHSTVKESVQGCNVNLFGRDFVVGVSAKFVSVALCSLGLVIRNSKDGNVLVEIKDYDTKCASVTFKSLPSKRENDVLYRNAVIDHAKDCIRDVRFIDTPEEYGIELVVDKAKKEHLSVSERGTADTRLDEILSDSKLYDLFGTVSDII